MDGAKDKRAEAYAARKAAAARKAEARHIATANSQAETLAALEVSGFPSEDAALSRLNGVYARGASDYENYRPAWTKLNDETQLGHLFHHGADGWVFSDRPATETHRYLCAARGKGDGAVPLGDATAWIA